VVDLGAPRPDDPTPPKDARFLSERNSVAEKETRSRYARAGFDRVAPVPTAAPPARGQGGGAMVSTPGQPGPAGKPATAPRVAMAQPPARPEPERGDAPDAGRAAERAPAPSTEPAPTTQGAPGGGGSRSSGRNGPDMSLSPALLARLAGGPSPDVGSAVEEGEATSLNARQFVFATYYNQINRALQGTWRPNEAYDKRDPDGTMFPTRTRVTAVKVRLDSDGRLQEARVVQPSGLEFLDRAAVDAFKEAQPFPNPPRALPVNGHIDLVWTFELIMDPSNPRLRIYRGSH